MPLNNLNPQTDLPVVPQPGAVDWRENPAAEDGGGGLRWTGMQDLRVMNYARELLPTGLPESLSVQVEQCHVQGPQLEHDESYCLERQAGRLTLRAATTWGALHGLSTCYQLARHGMLGNVERVADAPRFPWRGLLIDVARHFLPLATLRDVVDGMARLKLNVLHLHLSDDQAVRFQSRAFPALADDQSYSQAQLTELVTYAADRGVRVVPELDVPGHVHAWLVHYPAWGSTHTTGMPTPRFGVHKAALNPAREDVFSALDTLFGELCNVFPDEFVHIGGDEVHAAAWQDDTDVASLMHDLDLVDFSAVQNYFNQRVVKLLTARGKRVIGWDEVLHADMPDMVVQNWRGATTRDQVLDKSLDCIVSAPYYLDLFYPADIHYGFDPATSQHALLALEDALIDDPRFAHVAEGMAWTRQWRAGALDAVQGSGRILGGEACLWAELVDARVLPVRLWSRLPAVAERLWSAADRCDLSGFKARERQLFSLPEFDIVNMQSANLASIGLTGAQIEIVSLLEPVKWYARLLGAAALEARLSGREMPQARPYDTTTALNRIVDFLAPESLMASDMATWNYAAWQSQGELWAAQNATDYPADVQSAIHALVRVGRLLANAGDFSALAQHRDKLQSAYAPQGEYMLAPMAVLLRILPAVPS